MLHFHDLYLPFGLSEVHKETIYAVILGIFALAQMGIVFAPLRISKSVYSFAGGMLAWSMLALITPVDEFQLASQRATWTVGEVVFFLWFAMTIVEWIDHHGAFGVLSKIITTTDIDKLVVITIWMTFFISAVLDNVTASIVMGSLIKKLVASEENRNYFAGIIIIAANLGGIASPVGNTTSIQLWTGHQLTTGVMLHSLLLPSVLATLSVNLYFNARLSGRVYRPDLSQFSVDPDSIELPFGEQLGVLVFGVFCLTVGILGKVVLHQLPWMGMGTGLSIFMIGLSTWHFFKGDPYRIKFDLKGAMKHVDGGTLFFFIGVLMLTSGLGAIGTWQIASQWLDATVGTAAGPEGIAAVAGFASAFMSNSAIVASIQEAYPIVGETVTYVADSPFWQMIAFTAGAGGNLTPFGSSAGIAMMAVITSMSIRWYFRHMSLPALIAFVTGFGSFFVQEWLFAIFV